MLKGITKRNNAWHTRNTKRKAQLKVKRLARLAMYRSGDTRDLQTRAKMEEQYQRARLAEGGFKAGLWARVVAFIKNLFKQRIYVR